MGTRAGFPVKRLLFAVKRLLFAGLAVAVAAWAVHRWRADTDELGPEAASQEQVLRRIDAGWPTEILNGEVGPLKRIFLGALKTGRLDAKAATKALADNFAGEDFARRAREFDGVLSGIRVETWTDKDPGLDRDSFLRRFQEYLSGRGEPVSLEAHTWEIQLAKSGPGRIGLQTKDALWITSRLPDGRLREDRLLLVFFWSKPEGTKDWRITAIKSEDGRTLVGPGPYFHDVTAEVLPPGYDQIGAQVYTDGGAVLGDFDGDFDLDLFLPRIHGSARLYANDGSGHFQDVTQARGLQLNALAAGSNSGIFFDYDGDGRLDLVVGLKRKGLRLLHNEGPIFRDRSRLTGPGEWESLAVADYDGDGRLDIFACNYGLIDAEHQPESYVDANDGLPNVLLRNEGGGRFRDVTAESGLGKNRTRWSYAATWADYDRDGDMDLYVANDYGPNSLYRNDGKGHFQDVAVPSGAEDYGNGMGATWLDYDGDLRLDLYVSNMQSFAGNRITRLATFPGSPEQRRLYRRFSQGNTLLRNEGDGTFSNQTEKAGLKSAFWAWGNLAFDVDADADLDVFCCAGFYTGASAKDT